jgi:predicted P-loop ATPase/GTPase
MFNKGGTNSLNTTSNPSISSGNKSLDSVTSSLKIKKPVKISSVDDVDNPEIHDLTTNTDDVTKPTKKRTKTKSQKNEIQIPSRKEVIDKSKELTDKLTKDTHENEGFMINKREVDVGPKINLNFMQTDESDEESSKFYNNK